MNSPFSSESVQNGTFTKFISVSVMGLLTLSISVMYVYAFFFKIPVPDYIQNIFFACLVFFSKASGVVDGVNTVRSTIENMGSSLAPPITDGKKNE